MKQANICLECIECFIEEYKCSPNVGFVKFAHKIKKIGYKILKIERNNTKANIVYKKL